MKIPSLAFRIHRPARLLCEASLWQRHNHDLVPLLPILASKGQRMRILNTLTEHRGRGAQNRDN